MDSLFEFRPGLLPLMVSVPHAGTAVPDDIRARMTESSARLADTDWFVPRLYKLPELDDAGWIEAKMSRYVVDLNRPPDNESLYPGQITTGLCPATNFDGSPVYRDGAEPTPNEVAARVDKYWRPYHTQLKRSLDALRSEFGFVVLLDLHSIASRVPNLFPGALPDLNFGTNNRQSVDSSFQRMIEHLAVLPRRYSAVVNGRFIGGYITRHYGDPKRRIAALQIELSQATYLDERTREWDPGKAAKIQIALREILREIHGWIDSETMRTR
jgi:N-formylglutamate deformylase